MTVNELLTSPEHGPNGQIRRDRWGRYLLPHPDTGVEQPWTRVTTLSSTLADRFGLEKWMQRNIVYGIGQRQDLYARAAAAKLEDKDTLTEIVDAAQAAAADKAGANLGSAIHQFTERIDRGEQVNVPAPYDRDINAYQQVMDAAGIHPVMGWVEKIVIIPKLEVAGTLDRIVEGSWRLPRIADVKTGKDVVRYGMTEIALQLALYAHATHMWDGHGWNPMPTIDRLTGIVIHLPVGQGRCTLYEVDIDAGWHAVQLAVNVRAWRKRKDLAQQIPAISPAVQVADVADTTPTPLRVVSATPNPEIGEAVMNGFTITDAHTGEHLAGPPPPAQIQWLRERVARLINLGHGRALALLWSCTPDVPTFKQGGPQTLEHVERIIEMCVAVEADHGVPFGPPDPTLTPVTKATRRTK